MKASIITGQELHDKFMSYVYPEPNTGCWLWAGGKNDDGYGKFRYLGVKIKSSLAHRISYFFHKGEFDEKLCVCHTCDTPCCVNPQHLFLGTHHENMIDRSIKNRHGRKAPIGSNAYHAKLTEEDVINIRSLAGKMYQVDIASMYGIKQATVSAIVVRKTWKHL